MALLQLFSAFQSTPFAAVVQEVCVIAIFATSFALWRRINHRPAKAEGLVSTLFSRVGLVNSELSYVRKPYSKGAVPEEKHEQTTSVVRRKPDTHHVSSIRIAEQQMLKLLEGREFTRALNMYRSLERDGRDRHLVCEELFSAFIQSSIRVGKVDVVERMLRTIKRNEIVPTLGFWQTTLRMLSSRKQFSYCLSVHVLFSQHIPPDKVVFSCLINAALELGDADRAAQMLESYSEADIEAKDHVLFFRTYVALNDVESAEAIFRKLGNEITTLMMNLLLLTCVNTKQPERALRLLREAHAVEGTDKIVDSVSYNTVIKGFTQAGDAHNCFQCLHEMRDHGVEPDDITFGTLLDVCIVDNETAQAHEVVDLLISSGRPMDTVMCTLFIKGLVRSNCVQKAYDFFKEMKRRGGSDPDIVTYSVLIKAFIDAHDLDEALNMVEALKEAGHQPDDIILTHLLEGCRHAGNHSLGKKLFSEMLDVGVKPSEFTLITMVKLHGRCGAHEEAHDLVATWEKNYGTKPSVIHYTCLMSGCFRTKNYDQAWRAYELMCQNGIPPDETAMATLLPGMVAAQCWDRCIALVRRSLRGPTPVNIPAETLNNALSQMLACGSLGRHAEHLQELMKSAGIARTSRVVRR